MGRLASGAELGRQRRSLGHVVGVARVARLPADDVPVGLVQREGRRDLGHERCPGRPLGEGAAADDREVLLGTPVDRERLRHVVLAVATQLQRDGRRGDRDLAHGEGRHVGGGHASGRSVARRDGRPAGRRRVGGGRRQQNHGERRHQRSEDQRNLAHVCAFL